MSTSSIEWTDSTWNPTVGCTAVSAGCTNCYAITMSMRLDAMGMAKYRGLTRRSGSRTVWSGVVREEPDALQMPLRWKQPRKIFVNSMSDLFHPAIRMEFIERVWDVMEVTPRHCYQILTKRPGRMARVLAAMRKSPLPNVWLGTSVESCKVKSRIDALRKVDAPVRFISFEPLIGNVGRLVLSGIHWAIVGGESGPRARPMKLRWIDQIHAACVRSGTAFFFKQWGAWGEDNVRRSKVANGRVYRGRVWDEMPDASGNTN